MKLTTKLLLGVTLVTGLSMSAFAACANNVLMGDKQLKDVADGTDDKDAVNYAQVLKQTTADLVDANSSKITSYDTGSYKMRVVKNGNTCFLLGLARNVSGTTIAANSTNIVVNGYPAGMAPITEFRISSKISGAGNGTVDVAVRPTLIHIYPGIDWQANQWISIQTSYLCH